MVLGEAHEREYFSTVHSILEIERQIRLLKRYAKKVQKNDVLAQYIYLALARSLTYLARLLFLRILRNIAKEYRFYCVEASSSLSDNKYVKYACEVVKMDFRAVMALVRKTIENAKQILKGTKVQYDAVVSALSSIETYISEFERDPDKHLSEIARMLAEREEEYLRMKAQLDQFLDAVIKLLEDRTMVHVERRGSTTIYTCCICGRKFVSKLQLVDHMIREHVEISTNNSEEEVHAEDNA